MTFTLRDYQTLAIDAIHKSWDSVRSTLAVLPTGMGKTEIFCTVANDWPGRVMVIAPMLTLVGQAAKKIRQRTGAMPAIEQGSNRSNEHELCKSPFVVASKQTLCGRSKRYERFDDIGLVIIDEAHLAATKQYEVMLDHFRSRGAHVLGVTATPKRHDEVGMGQLFEDCPFNMGIGEAIDDGWLVAPRAVCCRLDSLDLSGVGTTKGDFKEGELAKAMEDEKVVFEVAEITAREYHGEKTVVFCASVREARAVSERLADTHNVKSDWICADEKLRTKQQRQEILRAFTEGDLEVCVNVGILTTGWDFPGLKHIVLARPTKSLSLYTQIFGRGTRALPGVVDFDGSDPASRKERIAASEKPFFRVTDLRDNSRRHKLITAVDVLAGKEIHDDVKKAAKKALEGGGDAKDVQEALAAAERAYRARVAAAARYKAEQVDVFDQGSRSHIPQRSGKVTRMPFGKHKGTPIQNIDTDYLKWVDGLGKKGWFAQAVKAELAYRGCKPARPKLKAETQALLSFFGIN